MRIFSWIHGPRKSLADPTEQKIAPSTPISKRRSGVRIIVTSRSSKTKHRDCDLCPAKWVRCREFTCGEGKIKLFVCAKCQSEFGGILNKNPSPNPIQQYRKPN